MTGPPAARLRPWLGTILLLVVLGAALAIGSRSGSGAPATSAQRAAALETQIRCPSCEDLSVAQSSAPTAVTVRQEIERWTARGWSDQRIESVLVASYGSAILLRPPDRGLTALVWVVPVVIAVGAAVALAVLFFRRTRELDRLRGASRPVATGGLELDR